MRIRVINQHLDRECVEGGVRVYIGRPSILGNPFVIGRDGDRAKVIAKFRTYLERKLAQGDPAITGELDRLIQISAAQPLELACYCAPADCHGDVIKETLLARIAQAPPA